MTRSLFGTGAFVAALLIGACSGSVGSTLSDSCTAGMSRACTCSGALGMQGCGANGTFLPCICTATTTTGTDGGVGAKPDGTTSCTDTAAVCAGRCGLLKNACGTVVQCGGCPEGETCGGGGPSTCGTGACAPSCNGKVCGASDGCGDVCTTGSCAVGQLCSAGGTCECGPSSCTGCCSGDSCQPGTGPELCGTGGESCTSCGVVFDAGDDDGGEDAGDDDGGTCDGYGDPCSPGSCCGPYTCDLTDLPTCDIPPGGACSPGDLCEGNDTCLPSGVCGQETPDAATCTPYGDGCQPGKCCPGLTCDTDHELCDVSPGGSCASGQTCANGGTCVSGVCKAATSSCSPYGTYGCLGGGVTCCAGLTCDQNLDVCYVAIGSSCAGANSHCAGVENVACLSSGVCGSTTTCGNAGSDCAKAACCTDYPCINFDDGTFTCETAGQCIPSGGSCEFLPCCPSAGACTKTTTGSFCG